MIRSNRLRFTNRHMRVGVAYFAAFVAQFAASSVYALDLHFQYHGFASQAYVKSKNNNFFGTSTGYGASQFREIGANASVRPFASLQTGAQIIYREAGNTDPGEMRVDFALVDYRPLSSETFDAGFRAGRIKNPMGFYNDTRDVAFTRPGVILPQSIYFDRVRDLGLSSDGMQLYGDYRTSDADINIQLHAAKPRMSTNTEIALFSRDMPGSLSANYSFLGRVSLDLFAGRVKIAYSDVNLFVDYLPVTGEPVTTNGAIRFYPKIGSIQLNFERYSFTMEYARRRFEFGGMSAYLPQSEIVGESFYAQAIIFLTPRIRTLFRYDITYLDTSDRDGAKMQLATNGARAAHTQYAKDLTVGLQWELHDQWLIMLEQHWVTGTAWLPIQDNPQSSLTSADWWMFNALLSFRF